MAGDPASNIYQIGQDRFYVEVWMYNYLEKYPPAQIPFFAINQLAIEENLLDWNITGYIVLESYYEILERGQQFKGKDPKNLLLLRTDGRNKISLKIRPVTVGSPPKEPEKKYWEMIYDCVIYDIQDISSVQDPSKKLRALYFRDEKYQIFSERNLEWSTSTGKFGLKDYLRADSGSNIIANLIYAASNINGENLKVGYTEDGSIDKPDISVDEFDDKNWAISSEGSRILYTSPGCNNVLKDLEYIRHLTNADDGSPVFLRYGRDKENKKWSLRSLTSYFEKSEKTQFEKIFILDNSDDKDTPPPADPRAYEYKDGGDPNDPKNFTSMIASRLFNYHFSPMVAIDDAKIVNTPLYGYSFAGGSYNVHFTPNKFETVRDNVEQMATKGLYNLKKKEDGMIVLNYNKTKSAGINTRNVFIPAPFYVTNNNAKKMMMDLVFLNQSIYFQLPGLTLRTPGNFCNIQRKVYSKNDFDDRFLGQWLMIKVTHVFTKANYVNDVVAVKIDSNSQLWSKNADAY